MIWKLFLISLLLSVNTFGSGLKPDALEFVPAAEKGVQVQAETETETETEEDVAKRYGMRSVHKSEVNLAQARNPDNHWALRFQYALKCSPEIQYNLMWQIARDLSNDCSTKRFLSQDLRAVILNKKIPENARMDIVQTALVWGSKSQKRDILKTLQTIGFFSPELIQESRGILSMYSWIFEPGSILTNDDDHDAWQTFYTEEYYEDYLSKLIYSLVLGNSDQKRSAVDSLWAIMEDPELPEELNQQAYSFILKYGDWDQKQPMLDVLLGNAYRGDFLDENRLFMLRTVYDFGNAYYKKRALEIKKEIDALYYESSGGGAFLPY